MSNAAIVGKTSSILLTAQQAGLAAIKCAITSDNGEVYNQLFRIEVLSGRVLFGDEGAYTAGPQVLTTP
jgi:hypothetical protein